MAAKQQPLFVRLRPYLPKAGYNCKSIRLTLQGKSRAFIGGLDPKFVPVTQSEADELAGMVQDSSRAASLPLFEIATEDQIRALEKHKQEAALRALGRQAGIDPSVIHDALTAQRAVDQAQLAQAARQTRRRAALANEQATAAPAAAAAVPAEDDSAATEDTPEAAGNDLTTASLTNLEDGAQLPPIRKRRQPRIAPDKPHPANP